MLTTVVTVLLHTTPEQTQEIIAVYEDGKRLCLMRLKPGKSLAQARRLARMVAHNLELAGYLED
jgi:hypothetical protein